MDRGEVTNSFETGTIRVVGIVKTTAELLTLTGLFSFIEKAYSSTEAKILNYVLIVALGAYVSANIQHYLLPLAKPSQRHFGKILLLVVTIGLAAAVATQVFVLSPTIRAIERQLGATSPDQALQAFPPRNEIRAQPSVGIAAPKPAAAPSSTAAPAPAPTAPPSAAENRNSEPEGLEPD